MFGISPVLHMNICLLYFSACAVVMSSVRRFLVWWDPLHAFTKQGGSKQGDADADCIMWGVGSRFFGSFGTLPIGLLGTKSQESPLTIIFFPIVSLKPLNFQKILNHSATLRLKVVTFLLLTMCWLVCCAVCNFRSKCYMLQDATKPMNSEGFCILYKK